MKKLGKLQINPKKLMKNEELMTLKGGSWEGWCCVYCEGAHYCGPASGDSCESALDTLASQYSWCQGTFLISCGDCGSGY